MSTGGEYTVDEVIKVDWYDLPENESDDFLNWLNNTYLSELQRQPGVCWVGHYRIAKRRSRRPTPDDPAIRETDNPEVGAGSQYTLLTAAASIDVFFGPESLVSALENREKGYLGRRQEHRTAVFIQETHIDGPEFRSRLPGTGPAPAIQLGSFNVTSFEDEFELARWYRKVRFPQISVTRGCIRCRKLLSAAGWSKHGVLYEFTSMDEDEASFELRFKKASRGEQWEGRAVLEYVIHAPHSPHAGRLIWPAH